MIFLVQVNIPAWIGVILKDSKMRSRPYDPIILTARHRQAIQLLVAGLPVGKAAKVAGISPSRLSVVRHSPVGQAYAEELHAKIDTLVVRMLALGKKPEDLMGGAL